MEQESLCVSFFLKIPQLSFEPTSGVITPFDTHLRVFPTMTTPVPAASATRISLVGSFLAASGTPLTRTPDPLSGTTAMVPALTRNIYKIIRLGSGGAFSCISYFGPIDFLENQLAFTTVFGHKPQIYKWSPTRLQQGDVQSKLCRYAEKFSKKIMLG